MTPYRLSAPAQRDLLDIWGYIAAHNETAADRIVDQLFDAFWMLGRRPTLGEVRHDLRPGLRAFCVRNYVVYYEVSGDRISISRVLHGARDAAAIFRQTLDD